MSAHKKNRVGEIYKLNCGANAKIIEYYNWDNCTILIMETNEIFKNIAFKHLKSGNLKSYFYPTVEGVGYIGNNFEENDSKTKCYKTWRGMLVRCYNKEYQYKKPTYKNCRVCEEWHNFSNFKKWYYENYYQIDDDIMQIDKDILEKGNKIYSPNTCIFVNNKINSIFTKHDGIRGEYPIGVFKRENGKFGASVSIDGKQHKLGIFDTVEEAFVPYKEAKEKEIKRIADLYKNQIPERLYNAMCNYEVDITD